VSDFYILEKQKKCSFIILTTIGIISSKFFFLEETINLVN